VSKDVASESKDVVCEKSITDEPVLEENVTVNVAGTNDNSLGMNINKDSVVTDGQTQESLEIKAPSLCPEKESDSSLSIESGKQNQLPPIPPKYKTPRKRSEGRRQLLPTTVECTPHNAIKRRSSEIKRPTAHQQSSLFAQSDETDEAPALIALVNRKGLDTPKGKETKVNLLANFIEYRDQRPSTPLIRPHTANKGTTKGRQSWPMTEPKTLRPSTSPLPSTRQLGVEKRRSLPDARKLSTRKNCDPADFDIPSSLTRRRSLLSPKTPESQRASIRSTHSRREVGLIKNHSIHELNEENQPDTRKNDVKRMTMTVISTAVKIFCSTCIMARCVTFLGGRRSFFFYFVDSPAIWIVRFYVLMFHAVLILVELKIGIPGILPRGTLNNFVHRAFIQSFIGLLDICLNSNRTLVEYGSHEISGSQAEKWVDLSFAVLRISPRGLIACACFYFMLAVIGKDGRSMSHRRFNGAPEFDA
jgi:hypothetical protein